MTEVAEARLPDAIGELLRGNEDALEGFSDAEAGQLVDLLTRLIANLDRVASVEASPGAALSETADGAEGAGRSRASPNPRRSPRRARSRPTPL